MADTSTTVRCEGGPLDGQQVTIVAADGFLAAAKAAGKVWKYERRPDGAFAVCTEHDDSLVYPHGPTTGERSLNWDRLPLSTDTLQVVSLGDHDEDFAGDPVDDGWVG